MNFDNNDGLNNKKDTLNNDNSDVLEIAPSSLADSLQEDNYQEKTPFTKTKTFYILMGALALLLISAIIAMVFMRSSKDGPTQQPIETPTPEAVEAANPTNKERLALQQSQAPVDPQIASLPPDDYVFSQTPVFTLTNQSVQDMLTALPMYVDNGSEITAPDGRFLPKNDPYILNSMNETQNMVQAYVDENRLLESRVDAETGQKGWYIRQGQGFTDTDFVPLQTPEASAMLRRQMRDYAVKTMEGKLASAPWQVKPNQRDPNAPIIAIDPALTQAERERLLSMIETQRTNNLELVSQNKKLREEMVDIKKKVVTLVQKLEDSPNINARLRATMLPESTGWKVTAVVGDRVYLMNKNKETVTLSQGDRIPSSDLIISNADENTGIVLVTPKN